MAKRHAQHGFTRTELLVVLAVIAAVIIACMRAPNYRREKANRVNCAGNLNQLSLGMLMYTGDYSGYFPCSTAPGSRNFEPLNTSNLIADGELWRCPSASTSLTLCRLSNYRYRGSGLKDDNAQAASITVAYDAAGNHMVRPTFWGLELSSPNCWMNALFIDGHVAGAKPDGSKGWNRND